MIYTTLISHNEKGVLDTPYWYTRVRDNADPVQGFAPAVDLPKYRMAEVVGCSLLEGDWRQITFKWVDDGNTFQRYFPLLYEHFHHASYPSLGQRMTWEAIQEKTTD